MAKRICRNNVSIEAKDNLIRYIKNQEAHHAKKSSKEEYIELLDLNEITYNEKYLFED
jgi:putative transposase